MAYSTSHSEPAEAPPRQRRVPLPGRQSGVEAEGPGSTAAAANVPAAPPTAGAATSLSAEPPSSGQQPAAAASSAQEQQEARLKELLLGLSKKNLSGSWGSQKRCSKNPRWAGFVPSSEGEIENMPAAERKKLEPDGPVRDKCEAITCWLCHLQAFGSVHQNFPRTGLPATTEEEVDEVELLHDYDPNDPHLAARKTTFVYNQQTSSNTLKYHVDKCASLLCLL